MVALICSRRSLALVGALLSGVRQKVVLTVEEASDLICTATPFAFRKAVRDSGNHFLYRGEHDVTMISILQPEPDLLVAGTYGNDPGALAYFEELERKLKQRPARPSQGHIGTSRPQDAAVWGEVVSVWPLGTEFDYVWPRSATTIYPGSDPSDLMVGIGVADALKSGTEVMFASSFKEGVFVRNTELVCPGSFIAIPRRFDHDVLELLQKQHYGLTNEGQLRIN